MNGNDGYTDFNIAQSANENRKKEINSLEERVKKLEAKVEQLEKDLQYTANTASCLANGIIPD